MCVGGIKLAARDVKTSVFECVSQCLLLLLCAYESMSVHVWVCVHVCVHACRHNFTCVGEYMAAWGVSECGWKSVKCTTVCESVTYYSCYIHTVVCESLQLCTWEVENVNTKLIKEGRRECISHVDARLYKKSKACTADQLDQVKIDLTKTWLRSKRVACVQVTYLQSLPKYQKCIMSLIYKEPCTYY